MSVIRVDPAEYWELKYKQAIAIILSSEERAADLMKQNDELSDRIHLDLNPRIVRLKENYDSVVHTRKHMKKQNDELAHIKEAYASVSVERLELLDANDELLKRINRLTAERNSYKASDKSACAEVDALMHKLDNIHEEVIR